MGPLKEQSQGPFLSTDQGRPGSAEIGDQGLAADRGHHWPILRGHSGGFAMRYLRRFIKRLASLAGRRRHDQRLQEEIEGHLSLQTEEYVRAGMTPAEAHRRAILKLGPVVAIRESYFAE